ncbi:hypothetical protein ACJRO7_026805 [Eucalyptus globulus]|uniref:Uncharacterized protein n=1 Tax=Eucalyptus globulus TaxID=34317 RepID=A0ABD3JQ37_EUCGL
MVGYGYGGLRGRTERRWMRFGSRRAKRTGGDGGMWPDIRVSVNGAEDWGFEGAHKMVLSVGGVGRSGKGKLGAVGKLCFITKRREGEGEAEKETGSNDGIHMKERAKLPIGREDPRAPGRFLCEN